MTEKLKYTVALISVVLSAFAYYFKSYQTAAVFLVLFLAFISLAIMHKSPPYEDENF